MEHQKKRCQNARRRGFHKADYSRGNNVCGDIGDDNGADNVKYEYGVNVLKIKNKFAPENGGAKMRAVVALITAVIILALLCYIFRDEIYLWIDKVLKSAEETSEMFNTQWQHA